VDDGPSPIGDERVACTVNPVRPAS